MDIGKSVIDLTCPHCRRKFKQQFGGLKANAVINCPKCHQSFRVQSSNIPSVAKKANQSIADLRRKAGRIFKG